MKAWLHFLGEKGLVVDETALPQNEMDDLMRLREAMNRSLRFLPGGKKRFSCLVQVLAAAWSLRRRKIAFSSCIAVQFHTALAAEKALMAHAWLSSGGEIIIQTTELWSERHGIARFGWIAS